MLNSSNGPESRLVRPLLLALGFAALIVYVVLLSRWQQFDAPATQEGTRGTGATPAKLELSRHLSAPGQGIAVAPSTRPEPGWTVPLIAFLVPLTIGFLWGWRASRKTWRHLEGQVAPRSRASAHGVSLDYEEEAETKDATRNHSQRREQVDHPIPPDVDAGQDTATIVQPDRDAGSLDGDRSLDDLTARLNTKDEVIEALEKIVRENRDEWGEREQEASDNLRRIASLEAELAAAHRLVEYSAAAASAAGPDSATPRPEVLARS